jgi:hypothetical protein
VSLKGLGGKTNWLAVIRQSWSNSDSDPKETRWGFNCGVLNTVKFNERAFCVGIFLVYSFRPRVI